MDGVGYGDNTKASIITRGLVEMTDFAVAFGAAGAAFGLIASYHLDVPTGATIILTHCAFFGGALALRRH